MPRWASRSSTSRKLRGNRKYSQRCTMPNTVTDSHPKGAACKGEFMYMKSGKCIDARNFPRSGAVRAGRNWITVEGDGKRCRPSP